MLFVSMSLTTIMLFLIANINSAVLNVPEDGGNSIKTVLIAEKRSVLFNLQMERKYNLMKSHKNPHKMTKISCQGVFNVGQILMKTRRRKPVTHAVLISFTRDV